MCLTWFGTALHALWSASDPEARPPLKCVATTHTPLPLIARPWQHRRTTCRSQHPSSRPAHTLPKPQWHGVAPCALALPPCAWGHTELQKHRRALLTWASKPQYVHPAILCLGRGISPSCSTSALSSCAAHKAPGSRRQAAGSSHSVQSAAQALVYSGSVTLLSSTSTWRAT